MTPNLMAIQFYWGEAAESHWLQSESLVSAWLVTMDFDRNPVVGVNASAQVGGQAHIWDPREFLR